MDKQLYRILISLICFMLMVGMVAGSLAASRVDTQTGSEIYSLLSAYKHGLQSGIAAEVSLWQALLNAWLFPLLAFLSGFTLLGVVLLPLLLAARGFMISFVFTSFISAFGPGGIWLALGEMGFQCLLSVPCLLLLSVYSGHSALRLLGLSTGRVLPGGGRMDKRIFLRLGICALALTACTLLDYTLSPPLQEWLARVL